jgi:hypothetical protein
MPKHEEPVRKHEEPGHPVKAHADDTPHAAHEEHTASTPKKSALSPAEKLATAPTPEQIERSIGLDYGGTGEYVYEELPPHADVKTVSLLHDGRQFWHVGIDLHGRWLYR